MNLRLSELVLAPASTAVSTAVAAAVVAAVCSASSSAQAQRRGSEEPPGVEVRVSQWSPPGAETENPYLYLFELVPTAWSTAEVVADRRLLRFTVKPEGSRRRYRCRHPDAPRRVPDGRVRTIGAGAEEARWQEWFDLRMYCWGRALRALEEGGEVEVTFGFPWRGRDRWVARRATPDDEEKGEVRELEGAPFTVPPEPEPEPREGPVRIEMRSVNVGSGDWVNFGVAVQANEGRPYVYVRDDLISFQVEGPLGATECRVPVQRIVPIVDFYRRLGGRRAARTSIDAGRWCPEGTFDVAGVYDVTPVIELIYDGRRYDFDAVTGRIEGRPTAVRVRRDDLGYVEHVPGAESTEAEEAAPDA